MKKANNYMTYDSFEKLINLMDELNIELDKFNEGLQNLLGSDTYCMYYKPSCIVENYIIEILQNEFNESKEGAEWFVYEAIPQIKRGGTEIEDNGKKWSIKSVKDYYEYLVSLKEI
jgi:hypothetical protein